MPDLITITDMQTLAGLNSLVEERKVKAAIEDAHDALKKVLGSTGYALVYASHGSYAALVALLKPWMAWYAKEKAVPDMYAEPDRAGIYVKEGQDHRAVRANELAIVTNQYRDRAERKLALVIDHLIANPTTYPWYGTNVDGEERIDSSTRTSAGISFRKASGQTRYRG